MTKRILSLFLVCILAIPIMILPTYASGWDAGDSATLEEIEADTDYIPIMWDVWQDFFDSWDGMFANIEYYTSHIKADLRLFYEEWDEWEDELLAHITTSFNDFHTNLTIIWSTVHNDLLDKLGLWFDSVSSKFDNVITALQNGFNSLILGSDEQKDLSDQFGDDINKQETIVDEYEDILNTAPTIAIDDIDGMLGGFDIQASLSPDYLEFIKTVMDIEIFWFLFMLIIPIATVGLILFGKR